MSAMRISMAPQSHDRDLKSKSKSPTSMDAQRPVTSGLERTYEKSLAPGRKAFITISKEKAFTNHHPFQIASRRVSTSMIVSGCRRENIMFIVNLQAVC